MEYCFFSLICLSDYLDSGRKDSPTMEAMVNTVANSGTGNSMMTIVIIKDITYVRKINVSHYWTFLYSL